MKKSFSEQHYLSLLATKGAEALSSIDLYKACAALANNGQKHAEEARLSELERTLQEARRCLSRGEIAQAQTLLHSLEDSVLTDLYAGDKHALLAILHHRNGNLSQVVPELDLSIEFFRKAKDGHRELRSEINRLICSSDCESSTTGALFALEQRAMREKYYDLAAGVGRGYALAVERTRAIELLRSCQPVEALIACRDSLRSYQLDGCPEDRLLALALLAIVEALCGNLAAANEARQGIFPICARVAIYIHCYEAILAGHTPQVPKSHALDSVPWKKMFLKPSSVTGKIISALKIKPLNRNELIEAVWGAQASHPSYRNRLYAAINSARKLNQANIYFDGENYRLR